MDGQRQEVRLAVWARWLTGVLGSGGLGAGAVAVFTTESEAGPVALLVVGVLLVLVALAGVMPTRLKLGDNEVQWEAAVRQIQSQTNEVAAHLRNAGVTDEKLATGSVGSSLSAEPTLARTAASLSGDVERVEALTSPDAIPPNAYLQLARWYATQFEWAESGRFYDRYVQYEPANWQAQFARGTVHANSRIGASSNFAALNAYDAAIAIRPEDLPPNTLSRMFTYRGAIKKRLGRLDEAEADVGLGAQLASQPRETVDAIYNMASIKALKGERDSAMEHIRRLVELTGPALVLRHRDDYFSSLKDDPEFTALLDRP